MYSVGQKVLVDNIHYTIESIGDLSSMINHMSMEEFNHLQRNGGYRYTYCLVSSVYDKRVVRTSSMVLIN